MSDEETGPPTPRVLSLTHYQFNFKVSVGAQVAARGGAPAFATRRMRWDRTVSRFWSELAVRHRALWIAAGEGRIDEEGREVRMALLDADGRDAHALRLHKQEVFRLRGDFDAAQRAHYDRAWGRVVTGLELSELEAQAAAYLKYFPMEANLPTDPETGRYIWLGKPWQTVRAPTRAAVLERYPLFEVAERLL